VIRLLAELEGEADGYGASVVLGCNKTHAYGTPDNAYSGQLIVYTEVRQEKNHAL
jgi:hypothetical protein